MGEDMDNNLGIFAERLKELRIYYGLSLSDMAFILCVNSKVNCNRWELGKNWPFIESLIRIANLFAVSMDWLVGNSDDKYLDKKIDILEAKLDVEFLSSKIAFPEDYRNVDSRREKYSLEQRAEIYTYLSILKFEWKRFLETEYIEVKITEKLTTEIFYERYWRKFSSQAKIIKYIERIEDVLIGSR